MKTRTFEPINKNRPIIRWTIEGGTLWSHYGNGAKLPSDHTIKHFLDMVAAGRVATETTEGAR